MGHFGTRPIRLTWFFVVFPSLFLNYFGQGAHLLANPQDAYHPFYAIVPHWAIVPMVVLSTIATIIASQAVITGAFSLTSQAIQLGYLPRLRVTHTSSDQIGQIYVGPVNWVLMVCTIGLVIGFQSSSKLAAAYGVAVTATMLITTSLFFVVMSRRWHLSVLAVVALTALFLIVDFSFFSANMAKIFHGAWFPLVIAGLAYTVMVTWDKGRTILAEKMKGLMPVLEIFLENLVSDPPRRIPGQAVFLARSHNLAPPAIIQNLAHNKTLHSEVYFLNIRTEEIPRIPNLEKIETEKMGSGIYRIIAHFGYMEEPKMALIFALCKGQGINIDIKKASFFIGREKLIVSDKPGMSRWRAYVFLYLSRNSIDAASFFDIPHKQVIEVGTQLGL